MHESAWVWAIFGGLVLAMLALDLGLASRGPRQGPSLRSAALWSGAWIGLSAAFGLIVFAIDGPGQAVTYFAAYFLEKSLSIDNIFVFVLIFSELRTPPVYQRKILYWGVLGALIMRGALIAAGIYLLDRFHWVVYPFAALIILAAVRFLFAREKERQVVVAACAVCNSWVARFLPVTPVLHGGKFVIRQRGRLVATPLLITLLVVESTDLVFALDSIPAVFAVTRDPFLVYTSNVLAMMGLRSLYFLLAGAVERFRYLRFGLAAILLFVGGKMLLSDVLDIPVWVSLAVVGVAVAGALVLSVIVGDRRAAAASLSTRTRLS
jgi:tellurite resistance protein TerC